MFLKLLTAVIIMLAVAFMFAGRRATLPQRETARAPARVPRADDLVKCGHCGVWLPAGERCDCAGQA